MSWIMIILKVAGILVTLDGFGNFLYWMNERPRHSNRLFQVGRLIRGLAGLSFTLLLGWKLKVVPV